MEYMMEAFPLDRNLDWLPNFRKNIKMLAQYIFY